MKLIKTLAMLLILAGIGAGAFIGLGIYNSMCVICHLSPGASDTELSLGLYPTPPTWSELSTTDPREVFWIVKHGVKMSGMPARGKSMDDKYI